MRSKDLLRFLSGRLDPIQDLRMQQDGQDQLLDRRLGLAFVEILLYEADIPLLLVLVRFALEDFAEHGGYAGLDLRSRGRFSCRGSSRQLGDGGLRRRRLTHDRQDVAEVMLQLGLADAVRGSK